MGLFTIPFFFLNSLAKKKDFFFFFLMFLAMRGAILIVFRYQQATSSARRSRIYPKIDTYCYADTNMKYSRLGGACADFELSEGVQ